MRVVFWCATHCCTKTNKLGEYISWITLHFWFKANYLPCAQITFLINISMYLISLALRFLLVFISEKSRTKATSSSHRVSQSME